jgi:hypothetical membrane protein
MSFNTFLLILGVLNYLLSITLFCVGDIGTALVFTGFSMLCIYFYDTKRKL